jgi:hypothetical protein
VCQKGVKLWEREKGQGLSYKARKHSNAKASSKKRKSEYKDKASQAQKSTGKLKKMQKDIFKTYLDEGEGGDSPYLSCRAQ